MINEDAFKKEVIARFRYYKTLGDKTFSQLSEQEMHQMPSAESNSIAIIIQHLYGNMMSRFTNFLTEDGEKSWRNRDAEFETMQVSRQDLIDFWETGWSTVFRAINEIEENQMMQEVTIRSEKLKVFDAILRQLAHYSYHIGQIVFIGKMIKNEGWKNLSVPKGESQAFNQSMKSGNIIEGAGGKV